MGMSKGINVTLFALASCGAAYLFLAGPSEGVVEYVYADQVVSNPSNFTGREIKVHGRVVEGTVRQKKNSSGDYRFVIHHEGKTLKVHYTDMVPDTFAEGGEVVLTGRLSADGTEIESDEMSAKCPSKYKEEPSAL